MRTATTFIDFPDIGTFYGRTSDADVLCLKAEERAKHLYSEYTVANQQ